MTYSVGYDFQFMNDVPVVGNPTGTVELSNNFGFTLGGSGVNSPNGSFGVSFPNTTGNARVSLDGKIIDADTGSTFSLTMKITGGPGGFSMVGTFLATYEAPFVILGSPMYSAGNISGRATADLLTLAEDEEYVLTLFTVQAPVLSQV